jgi:hypothetical protein
MESSEVMNLKSSRRTQCVSNRSVIKGVYCGLVLAIPE